MSNRVMKNGKIIETIDGMPLKDKETYTVDFVCKVSVVGMQVKAFNEDDVASLVEEKLDEIFAKTTASLQPMYAYQLGYGEGSNGISGCWVSIDHVRRVEKDGKAVYVSQVVTAEERRKDVERAKEMGEPYLLASCPVNDMPINLSVYHDNILRGHGIETVGQLAQKTEEEVKGWEKIGKKAMDELKAVLAEHGLHFGMTKEEIAGVVLDSREGETGE